MVNTVCAGSGRQHSTESSVSTVRVIVGKTAQGLVVNTVKAVVGNTDTASDGQHCA